MIKKSFLIQLIILFSISITAIIAYSPSIDGSYFGDDFSFNFSKTDLSIKSILTPSHNHSYRPIEKLFLATMQQKFPGNTVPIHAFQLFLHLLTSILLMIWMRQQGFSKFCSALAFGIMALAQANSLAVSSLDTFSQVTCALFGYSSLALFLQYMKDSTKSKYHLYFISFLLLIIALFCKETAMSFAPMMSIIVFFYCIKNYSVNRSKCNIMLISLIPFLVASGALMLLRRYLNLLPAEFGQGRYNIGFGFNIVKNFILSAIHVIQAHSSVDIYLAITNSNWFILSFAMLFSTVIVLIAIYGVHLGKQQYVFTILLTLLPLSLFPVICLMHVSEGYTYNMMPLIAIILGIGLGSFYENQKSPFLKIIAFCLITGFLFWNSISIFRKSTMMKRNGIEAEQILQKIEPYLPEIPFGGQLVLVNPNTSSKTEYSVFKLTGFRLLEFGTIEIARRAGRYDFPTHIIMEKDLNSTYINNSLVLRYKDGSVSKEPISQ
ncbi:MAG TPA: hypothetical protein VHP36_02995 [Chitinispirillaceae bacterium]|nr:hypothetical protein [Chitinispirillaceae bacterium]